MGHTLQIPEVAVSKVIHRFFWVVPHGRSVLPNLQNTLVLMLTFSLGLAHCPLLRESKGNFVVVSMSSSQKSYEWGSMGFLVLGFLFFCSKRLLIFKL